MGTRVLWPLAITAILAVINLAGLPPRLPSDSVSTGSLPTAEAPAEAPPRSLLKRAIRATLDKDLSCPPSVDPIAACGPRLTHIASVKTTYAPPDDQCGGVPVNRERFDDYVRTWIAQNWRALPLQGPLVSSPPMVLACGWQTSQGGDHSLEALLMAPAPPQHGVDKGYPKCRVATPTPAPPPDCVPTPRDSPETAIRIPIDIDRVRN